MRARSGSVGDGFSDRLEDPEFGEEPAWADGGSAELESQPGGADSSPDETDPAWGGRADDLEEPAETPGDGPSPSEESVSYGKLVAAFGVGVVFVAVPMLAYVATAPDHSRFIGTCGSIDERPAPDLLVEMDDGGETPALEVFDPLCPACRAFEQRLADTAYDDKLDRKAVMFPLDEECNWMLDKSVHPGACAVSEAVLCADREADKVIDWAFDHQEQIRKRAEGNPEAAREMIKQEFPHLASCVGSPKVEQRLNQSLRWAVDEKLKVLTPQIYVDRVRLCDADVDLGLEFALSTMIDRSKEGTLRPSAEGEQTEKE